jgi:hypothetical protein
MFGKVAGREKLYMTITPSFQRRAERPVVTVG